MIRDPIKLTTPLTDLFAGGGEMGALMRATDWSKTGLGPIENWPKSLTTMLGVVLGSRFPMLLWWGLDLLHLYNDAYRPILRDKHPDSLGAPAAEVWAEVWDVAGPMAKGVQEGGPATWTEDLHLFIKSGDMAEETYFTFSYSPVPGEDGRVGGILNTVQETTAKVQSERQIRMLHDLAARAGQAKSADQAYRLASEVLAANEADLPFALLYVMNEKADEARLVAESGVKEYQGRAKPMQVTIGDLSALSWPFAEVVRTGEEVVLDDLVSRFGPLPLGQWNARPERAIVLPLSRAGQSAPHAFLVAGVSPHRALDERYRLFFRATADQVGNVIATARAYEAENKRAEALVEIDQLKTEFFANVSHELRTPLALIIGPTEKLLASGVGGAAARHDLDVILRNARLLHHHVDDLLDISKLEAGKMGLQPAEADLAHLVRLTAGHFESLAQERNIQYTVEAPGPLTAQVDLDKVQRVLMNLLSNALKFTPEGGRIRCTLRPEGSEHVLEVADSGPGVPPEFRQAVFERFRQIDGGATRRTGGTGLGLAIARDFVALHGGSIGVGPAPEGGALFTVRLPVKAPDGFAIVPAKSLELSEGAKALWAGNLSPHEGLAEADVASAPDGRPLVLVVEDNPEMNAFVREALPSDFRTASARNGREGLDMAVALRPDLIVTDIMMPEMSGDELVREIRALPAFELTPILLLSAKADDELRIRLLETGANDYVMKPFSVGELRARARILVETKRAEEQNRRLHADLQDRHVRLEQVSASLERTNQELEAFSYSVSHDLRAPLRAITGFAGLLVESQGSRLDAEGMRLATVIRENTALMSRLIDDLLAFSRLDRKSLRPMRVGMTDLARSVAAASLADEGEREVDLQVGELPDAVCDPSLFHQVWANLIDNAIKYTRARPQAVIQIRGRTEGGEVIYEVQDNGVGFNMQYAGKLFGVFQRLHSSTEFEGTGIGLALVRRIVSRHGGRVWGEGEVDRGATFGFALPLDPEASSLKS